MTDDQIADSFAIVDGNWKNWRNEFQHGSVATTNPVLATSTRFGKFCREYSVSRTIRKGTKEAFRAKLIDELPAVVRDSTGTALDEIELLLRSDFGTVAGTRSMISVLSKVAAFMRPERFIAWDRFARKGLNRTLGRSGGQPFANYAAYLVDVDQAWNGQLGRKIRDYAAKTFDQNALERELRFQRRVLDVALMKLGGRTFKPKTSAI